MADSGRDEGLTGKRSADEISSAARAGAATTAKDGKGKAQGREETCSICQCEFTVAGDSGEGLACAASHFMCSECSGIFVLSVMAELETAFPPKCSLCKGTIPQEAFERQLTSDQLDKCASFIACASLEPGEIIVSCHLCNYYEIRTDDPVMWWCMACHLAICRVCKETVETVDDNMSSQEMDEASMEAERHLTVCARLRDLKQRVEDALEKGSKMSCPSCGISGRKDDACMHMTCMKCATSWCYFCGLSVKDCDKAPPREGREAEDIYLHNSEWDTNDKRCPMYLSQILDVDPDWLGEWCEEYEEQNEEDLEERCLNHFHEWRTIKLLQELLLDIGEESMGELWDRFASLRNSGFTLIQIMSTETSALIDRSGEGWVGEEA